MRNFLPKIAALTTALLVLGWAIAQSWPSLGPMEAARKAQAHLGAPTPPEEVSLFWSQGQPIYAVDLARGRALVQVHVDGLSGRVIKVLPLKEKALGKRAWLQAPPKVSFQEAALLAQKALGTQEPVAEVAYQVWRGRPVLRVDLGKRQALLDAQTGTPLGLGPAGQ